MNQQIMTETGERQPAEQELRRQQAYIEQIIENSPVAISVMNIDGAITRINREFTRLFGYTFEEIAVRILIASGYGPVGQAQEALKSGAKGFIGKPYRIEDMLAAIRKVTAPAGSVV
ncbi:MAG: PAS domain S-box protein [Pseudomonadota bacterium]